MTAHSKSREYWHGVLVTGGSIAIPHWTREPVAGAAEFVAETPADIAAGIDRLARELGIPIASILLAAHARVLAALSGEREVTIGVVVGEPGRVLPCRLSTEPESWRSLLTGVHRAASELQSHAEFPFDALQRELGLTPPAFDSVCSVTGVGCRLPDNVALSLDGTPDGRRLTLRYRTERLDAEAAARIAGYHFTAMAHMATDLDATHARQSLLSDGELRYQLEDMAGPRRELPDARVHELFEQRAKQHPDAIAAVHRGREWTYRELNARANRLGRALRARGVDREAVVAVVTERNLDWMAAVLALFKSGCVYLPIEPHFPADRIANMLSRAGCTLVITEAGSTATLERALATLPWARMLLVDTAYREAHADDDLGIEVLPDQLAYIFFTSGSTGEPKGAMSDHAGMLNHIFAKIADLRIREDDVVAQVAPQCFDISLWQFIAAVVVGGKTLIVEQEAILDVASFVERIAGARVSVLQVVPSYLDVLLTFLHQQARDLPRLRLVSVTGEAVTKELTVRWFAAMPAVQLVNAYGLTETSDDTNHEVMDRAPEGKQVPLGRPIQNVHVYVVDEQLFPVPLGAPGEIVFSGVCVGRGYINDPERTRLAFMADPLRAGQRLYRSGDFGFWRADGRLEFLGRRDAQVKIRGFRIEIGDIENGLTRLPGVRRGAVVVDQRADGSRQLVAFYSGERTDASALRAGLDQSLPEYMIPAAFHWRDSLPLTANGKIDRKSLVALAAQLGAAGERQAPGTPAEQRLAAAWAQVLGIAAEQVGRQDHFFDRGGTSLSAVKLVIALKSAVSLQEVTRHPVLADLALLIEGRDVRPPIAAANGAGAQVLEARSCE